MEGENSEIKDYKSNQVIKIISKNHDRIQNSTTIQGHGLKAVATQYTYWQNTAINSGLLTAHSQHPTWQSVPKHYLNGLWERREIDTEFWW